MYTKLGESGGERIGNADTLVRGGGEMVAGEGVSLGHAGMGGKLEDTVRGSGVG